MTVSGPPHDTLCPDRFVDSDHPSVIAFARHHAGDRPPLRAAVALFYAVRDGFRYTPWRVRFDADAFRASGLLDRDPPEGHCIDKALLLAASCRAVGIPARLHFANVRNHLGTARLQERLGSDLLVFHGYAELWLEGRWVAATPAFNRALCERLGVAPLEFDGRADCIFQEHDPTGRFMERVTDHGSFATLPYQAMIDEWARHYPQVAVNGWPSPD